MSTETPETTNPYQLRRKAIARAIKVWQDGDGTIDGCEIDDATALEDCLLDEGLTLMPRSTGHGKWRVLVDGQPAPYPGQDAPSHPMGAEEAAEAFLTATAADYYGQKQIVIRPASDQEMVASAVIGDATVREEPTNISPVVFDIDSNTKTGEALVRMIDREGRKVHVSLDGPLRDLLVRMLDRKDGAA